MTIEEALLNLKTHIGWVRRVLKEEIGSLFIESVETLMKKEIEYKWHDLRKDPKDLPDKSGMYLVCIEYPTEEKEVGVGYYKNMYGYEGWIALIPNDGEVIAWKEIEPFEEN